MRWEREGGGIFKNDLLGDRGAFGELVIIITIISNYYLQQRQVLFWSTFCIKELNKFSDIFVPLADARYR